MPRAASRITLEVESVRLERLQEISVDDVIAEGVLIYIDPKGCAPGMARPMVRVTGAFPPIQYLPKEPIEADFYRAEYASLWDSLNAKRAPWSSNPWVFVISFRRLTQ